MRAILLAAFLCGLTSSSNAQLASSSAPSTSPQFDAAVSTNDSSGTWQLKSQQSPVVQPAAVAAVPLVSAEAAWLLEKAGGAILSKFFTDAFADTWRSDVSRKLDTLLERTEEILQQLKALGMKIDDIPLRTVSHETRLQIGAKMVQLRIEYEGFKNGKPVDAAQIGRLEQLAITLSTNVLMPTQDHERGCLLYLQTISGYYAIAAAAKYTTYPTGSVKAFARVMLDYLGRCVSPQNENGFQYALDRLLSSAKAEEVATAARCWGVGTYGPHAQHCSSREGRGGRFERFGCVGDECLGFTKVAKRSRNHVSILVDGNIKLRFSARIEERNGGDTPFCPPFPGLPNEWVANFYDLCTQEIFAQRRDVILSSFNARADKYKELMDRAEELQKHIQAIKDASGVLSKFAGKL